MLTILILLGYFGKEIKEQELSKSNVQKKEYKDEQSVGRRLMTGLMD